MIRQYAPPGPWMYTGGLENYPRLVGEISKHRVLWGVESPCLRALRNPKCLAEWTNEALDPVKVAADAALRKTIGITIQSPQVRLLPEGLPTDGSWLLKPRGGAGGKGIKSWTGCAHHSNRSFEGFFFQRFVPGRAASALFLGVPKEICFLGLTRQLVGEAWLHAPQFAYCGTIGPIATPGLLGARLLRIGHWLYDSFAMKGVLGVDCILQNNIPWVIEVNPRYTAAVEVLEHAFAGQAYLSRYPEIFGKQSEPCTGSGEPRADWPTDGWLRRSQTPFIGKAILFAKSALVFPADGPWSRVFRDPPDVRDMPPYADIPVARTLIAAGQPILTFFAGAHSEEACLEELKRLAAELDRWLYKG
jgi:uncharacterized protein